MRLHVCNRQEACRWNPIGVPHAIISITTPGDGEAEVCTNEHTRTVLRLSFHDLDREPGSAFREAYGKPVLFDETHADQIKTCLETDAAGVGCIIVHCDAGQSRSPAVAAALARRYNGDDHEFWGGNTMYGARRYTPNRLVYRVLLDILMGWRRYTHAKFALTNDGDKE